MERGQQEDKTAALLLSTNLQYVVDVSSTLAALIIGNDCVMTCYFILLLFLLLFFLFFFYIIIIYFFNYYFFLFIWKTFFFNAMAAHLRFKVGGNSVWFWRHAVVYCLVGTRVRGHCGSWTGSVLLPDLHPVPRSCEAIVYHKRERHVAPW